MKIVFMGTPQPAVPSLKRLLEDGHQIAAVWTQPHRPAGRGRKLKAPPVKEFGSAHGLPVFQPEKIKTRESISLFQSHQADVAVVVAYGRILTKPYLTAFPNGAINVHFSLLPKYRGAAPVNWAIVNGETETGVTTMKMDRGLDTGDILLQAETKIADDETAVQLMDRLSMIGAGLLSDTISNIENLTPVAQNDENATYAPLMTKEDGLISWELTAGEINNRVRGFQPFPRTFSKFRSQKLAIWRAKVIEDLAIKFDKPGEVLVSNGDDLLVGCGRNTVLKIIELQIEGKRRMKARDFINGVRPEVGERLG